MANPVHLYLGIVQAELEDLLEDIETMELRLAERFRKWEVTDYVFKENEAFFSGEAHALEELLAYVKQLDVAPFATVDELITAIEKKTREIVKNHESIEALSGFVTRKLNKARLYVRHHVA